MKRGFPNDCSVALPRHSRIIKSCPDKVQNRQICQKIDYNQILTRNLFISRVYHYAE